MPRRPHAVNADDLLTRLARLTAQARERVELQQARVELAEALQRGMLPAELPSLPGIRIAAQYAPARHGLDIGGDWYDSFRLPDGSLAFSIGDVQGHDVEAAAFMGQTRVGLRAVATLGTSVSPGEILSRANDLLLATGSELFATCALFHFDPATRVLSGARAGHVGAVWSTVDGRAGVIEDEGGLPLGIEPGQTYPVTRRRLVDPGALVLLTDGVVEGPSLPIEEGLARVAQVAAVGAGAAAEELAARVMGVAALSDHEDDAAVLVLRHDGLRGGGLRGGGSPGSGRGVTDGLT